MDKRQAKRPVPVGPSFERRDERGSFIEIVNEGPWETIIHGSMKKDKVMGNHYHRECRAFFYLINGKAEVRIKHLVDGTSDTVVLTAGRGVYLLPFEVHKVRYMEDSDFILLKSYRYKESNPDIFPNEIE
ncbi:MAG: WxcM-like domain-containing protein [Candidatus Lindowbacteria bacterium]|nr:WxcM-like domain-containing protein [Candidatus Lindowbacteria bacterium]